MTRLAAAAHLEADYIGKGQWYGLCGKSANILLFLQGNICREILGSIPAVSHAYKPSRQTPAYGLHFSSQPAQPMHFTHSHILCSFLFLSPWHQPAHAFVLPLS